MSLPPADASAPPEPDTAKETEPGAYHVLRGVGALVAIGLLGIVFDRIDGAGAAALYVATWVTVLHAFVGELLLARYVDAALRTHRGLDLMAFVFLLGAMVSFASPALWCAFFGALFGVAIAKYLLVEAFSPNETLRRYARLKIRWESPAVAGFVLLALLFDALPAHSLEANLLQFAVLAITSAFALWMLIVRRVYQHLVRDLRAPEEALQGGEEVPAGQGQP